MNKLYTESQDKEEEYRKAIWEAKKKMLAQLIDINKNKCERSLKGNDYNTSKFLKKVDNYEEDIK